MITVLWLAIVLLVLLLFLILLWLAGTVLAVAIGGKWLVLRS